MLGASDAASPLRARRAASSTRWLGWGFVAPALILLLALNVFPLLFNIYLSLPTLTSPVAQPKSSVRAITRCCLATRVTQTL